MIIALRLGGDLNAREIAQLLGMPSREAVYAARYRFRHGYPARRRRGPLGVHYEYVGLPPQKTKPNERG